MPCIARNLPRTWLLSKAEAIRVGSACDTKTLDQRAVGRVSSSLPPPPKKRGFAPLVAAEAAVTAETAVMLAQQRLALILGGRQIVAPTKTA